MGAGSRATMKVLTILASIPITKGVQIVIAKIWSKLRPEQPTTNSQDPQVKAGDAIGYAALSAAGVVAAQLLTRKSAETAYRKVLGLEPPPPPPTRVEKRLAKQEAKEAKAEAKAAKKK